MVGTQFKKVSTIVRSDSLMTNPSASDMVRNQVRLAEVARIRPAGVSSGERKEIARAYLLAAAHP